jgi:hypothetical protein
MRVLLLLLLLPAVCYAQKDPIDTVQFNYTSVETVDSIPAKVLQQRARVFVTENFKSAKDVIQLDDMEAGVIIVKGVIVPIVKTAFTGSMQAGYVNFMIKLQFKDGKYKYSFTDFIHEGNGGNVKDGGALSNIKPACGTFNMFEGYWRKIKAYVDSDVIVFIDNLNRSMKNSDISAKKDAF